jgi:hypothetical protein
MAFGHDMNRANAYRIDWLIAATLLVLASFTSAQAQTTEGKAVVRAILGSAKYSSGGGVWAPLKVGQTLRPGSTIQTAADSTVDCFLGANGPVVRVTPDTTMAFDKLGVTKTEGESVIDTELNLSSGRILGNVKKLAAASKYEVKVPNGVAGIRGTDYEVRVTPNANGTFTVTVTCVTGQVVAAVVVDGTTRTAVLGDKQTWNSTTGKIVALTREQINEIYPCLCFDPIPAATIPIPAVETHLTSQTGNLFVKSDPYKLPPSEQGGPDLSQQP